MQTRILPVISECIIAFNLPLQQYTTIGPCIGMLSGHSDKEVPAVINFWHSVIHPDDIERVKAVTSLLHEGDSVELNYRIIPADDSGMRYITEKRSIYTDAITGQQILLSVLNEHSSATGSETLKREQFLLSLINSQTNFMIRLNMEGRFTFGNKQFFRAFGYKEDEIIGQHFSETVTPDDLELCERAFISCVGNPGKIIPLVHHKFDKKGERRLTEWEFISIINEKGEVSEIQGVGQDITQRIQTEREVKRTSEQLDYFIESITDSFVIVDNKWRFIRTNQAFLKIFKRTAFEVIGKTVWEVFPTIINLQFAKELRKAAETKQSVQFTEFLPITKLWFRNTIYPSAEGLTVFMKNITGQKLAEEELNRARNNLESLINNTDDLIWSIDANGCYIYTNSAYKNAVVKEAGTIPQNGQPVVIYGPEETQNAWRSYYTRALGGESYSIVYENTHSIPGEQLYYEVNFNPMHDSAGNIIGTGCFARETTSRLRSEREIVAQNERLRHIASLSSHELRRPVASMLGLINVIDFENFSNPENKEAINLLLEVGNEIDEVIRTIVDNTFIGRHPGEK